MQAIKLVVAGDGAVGKVSHKTHKRTTQTFFWYSIDVFVYYLHNLRVPSLHSYGKSREGWVDERSF